MLGIDIIAISRMARFVAQFKQNGLERFLDKREIALCLKPAKATKSDKSKFIDSVNIARVAGFWAAKEALSKALGVGIGAELGFLDMRIYKNHKNQPRIALEDEKMHDFGIHNIALSISHDGDFAIAAVIVESKK